MLAEILADTLSDRDFDVRLACDGTEALEILRREEIDLAVLDVMLPGKDGFELMEDFQRAGIP